MEYGIEQLGEHADGAAKMLRKIATDFDGLEKELEAALQSKPYIGVFTLDTASMDYWGSSAR